MTAKSCSSPARTRKRRATFRRRSRCWTAIGFQPEESSRTACPSHALYQPVGVCALITPWNYPVSLLSRKLGPALAAGRTAIVKLTNVTPLSPTAFCRELVESGLPTGVVAVSNGRGSTVGEALMRHPLLAKIAMTGSTATGRRLMALAGPAFKIISLELGGHCPAIVCADADPDLAAKVIAYKEFRNMGQSCSSVNCGFAHRSAHDAPVEKVAALVSKLTIGNGLVDPKVDLGPMTTARGLATVREHIADAIQKGARLVCGGRPPDGQVFSRGHYFLPTVHTHAMREMRVMYLNLKHVKTLVG
jgi:acyl-CoA reductase-like NAD-dependent aldehyde dehydrogenase